MVKSSLYTVGKEVIALYEQFPLLATVFSKDSQVLLTRKIQGLFGKVLSNK